MSEHRSTPAPPSEIRPLVARRGSGRGVWLFAAAMALTATGLFAALESHRVAITAPAIAPGSDDMGATIAPPPDIAIPPEPTSSPTVYAPPAASAIAPGAMATGGAPAYRVQTPPAVPTPVQITQPSLPVTPPVTVSTPGPQVVYNAPQGRAPGSANTSDGTSGKGERVDATRFANPATTVPKGAVMQAVLESALDSTRAGLARAIISRDVYGFSGTQVLIPRGSRLIGEYNSDLAAGQHRALIQWQRLMRPDGVIINLDSPSADPLGRAGVEGKVNSHFMARFGGAILQSSLNVGSEIAASKITSGATIYAVPGISALQGTAQGTQGGSLGTQNAQPTLTVKQGTSISVFVARDLDFTSVGQ